MLKLGKKKIIIYVIGSVLGIVFVVIPLFLVAAYLYLFQQTYNEGQDLIDEHCNKVNPLIISRRNKYNDYLKLIASGISTHKQVTDAQEAYSVAVAKYTDEESKWLERYKNFLDDKYTKVYMLPESYEMENIRYQMYQKDFEISSMLAYMEKNQGNTDLLKDYEQKVYQAIDIRNQLYDEYDALNTHSNSWQFRFIRTPKMNCPQEYQDIPKVDIQEIFTPKIPAERSQSSG